MTWHRPARILVGVVGAGQRGRGLRVEHAPPRRSRRRSSAWTRRPSSKAAPRVLQQVRENEEQFELKAERTLHYEDGSTRQYGIRLSVRNRSGRDYIVTAKEARAGKEAKDLRTGRRRTVGGQ